MASGEETVVGLAAAETREGGKERYTESPLSTAPDVTAAARVSHPPGMTSWDPET